MNTEFSWILDKEDTNHIIFTIFHFTNFYKIKFVQTKLHSHVTTNYVRTIHFSKSFITFNVMYIPYFSFNIIYVQCLIQHMHYQLLFKHNFCHIQDPTTLKMIGLDESNKNLYYRIYLVNQE